MPKDIIRALMRAIGLFESADQDALQHMDRAFIDFCALKMHQPVATFRSGGEGISAYERLREYMSTSGSEFLVVVPDSTHLGGDLEAVTRRLLELDALGAAVACSNEELPDPLQNAIQTIGVSGVSQARSESISESMRARALEGRALGRTSYGYRIGPDGRLAVVPDEAEVVRLMFRLYTEDGLGIRLIAQRLNDQGMRTRRGGAWSLAAVHDLLKNPAYIGTATRFGMRRPRAHPAIVTPETFRAAQDIARKRRPFRRAPRSHPFLLSGLAHCGYCGNRMMGVTRKRSWKRKNGLRARAVYRYYQCQSRSNEGRCGYHTWREPILEEAVVTELRNSLRSVDSAATKSTGSEAHSHKQKGLAGNAERRFLTAVRRSARGEAPIAALGGYLKDLDATREALKEDHAPADPERVKAWETMDAESRRAFLVEHVRAVTVKDDGVLVTV